MAEPPTTHAESEREYARPQCARCGKPVESLKVTTSPRERHTIIVEYGCHGQRVRQELPASVVEDERGLADYVAFNEYTSGLMPRH